MAISKHADIVCKLHRVITDLLKKEAAEGRRLLPAAAAVSSHSVCVRARCREKYIIIANGLHWGVRRHVSCPGKNPVGSLTLSVGRSSAFIINNLGTDIENNYVFLPGRESGTKLEALLAGRSGLGEWAAFA